MTAAIIRLDQSRPSGGPGSNGIARNDLWQNRLCTLTSVNAAGAYQWTILDKPPGSTASLTNPTSQVATFTPDKSGLDGTYRVMLGLDGGGPDSLVGTYMILVFRARYDVNGNLLDRGWCMPAVGEELLESNYGGNARGYDEPWRFMMHDVLASIVATSATPGGDLAGGSVASAQVVGLRGIPIKNTLPNDGDVPTYVAGATDIEWKAPTIPDLVGDTHGPVGATITSRLRGAAIATAAGALVLGTVLQATGASTLDYAALDLANANATANQLAGSKVVPNFGAQDLTSRDGHFTRDVIVGGNLTIQGTTTTVDSTTIDLEARMIHANFAPIGSVPVPILITGIEVERGDGGVTKRDAAGIIWNESSAEWTFAFQTAANDTAIGAPLQIKALGGTFTSLSGSGSGYATVNNNGTLGFTTTIGSGAISPGSAGQVFITDVTPLPVWTSLINVELTHGRFQSGGSGSDYKTIIGALVSFETGDAGIWFLPAATTPTSSNVALWCDASNTYMNNGNGSATLAFIVAGSTYLGAFNGAQGRFYAGGSTSAAPFAIDWGATANQTQIFSGTAATSLLVYNTNAGASIIFQPGSSGITWRDSGTVQRGSIDMAHGIAKFGGAGSDYYASLGPDDTNPTLESCLWLLAPGTPRSGSNMSMLFNSSATYLNTPANFLSFSTNSFGVNLAWMQGSLSQFYLWNMPNFTWNVSGGAPILLHEPRTSDIATSDFTITPQQPFSGAVTNILGGNLIADLHTVGSPNQGPFFSVRNNGVHVCDIGEYSSTGYGAIWFKQATPNQTNWSFLSDGAGTYFNGPGGDLYFGIAAVYYAHITSTYQTLGGINTTLSNFVFDWSTINTTMHFYEGTSASWAATIKVDAASSDHAVQNLTIRGQYAFATATGTNRIPGYIIFDVGAPTNGLTGVANEAEFQWARGGTVLQSLKFDNVNDIAVCRLPNTSWEFEWVVGNGEIVLANNLFATGGGAAWWISAQTTTVFFGGFVTATSPVIIDFTTSTQPTIRSGSNATVFGIGTNHSGGILTLQADTGQDLVEISLAQIDMGAGNSPSIVLGASVLYLSGAGSTVSGAFSLVGTGVVVLVDTSGGVATCSLPATASLTAGAAFFMVADYAKTFGTNKCTFVRNGAQKINGIAANYDATSTGAIYFLIFDGADWVIRGT